ncbi:MAG: C69 family dipeptidase [Kiritimatiellae bacterium]|nr:C69 family dipeptidase [Kiritimatiellia bacterium]
MKNVKSVVCAGMCAVGTAAAACTGIYVGRGVSADGTTIIARTVDSTVGRCKRFDIQPRVENAPGRHYLGNDMKAEWPLPATTYHAVLVPSVPWGPKNGRYDGSCANEKGVMLSGTVTAYPTIAATNADPFVSTGFAEATLPGLLISCAATAREAVELLGKVVGSRGHRGSEIYMVADEKEAWYVEVYTGHQWAAVRMPEDKMLFIGNQFMLREFDPASPDTLCSPDLIGLAERNGFLKRGKGGLIDLAATYAREPLHASALRTWMGRRRFAPSEAGAYDRMKLLPLFFTPDHKVTLREVQEVMRWRYEGTELCPEQGADKDTVRVVGVGRQSTCHALVLDATLPADRRCTMWVTLSNAEHAPFLPLNAAVTALADGYDAADMHAGERFCDAIPAAHYRRLCALAELDRRQYGDGVREFWRAREDRWLEEFPRLVRAGDAAAITAYAVEAQRTALCDAKRIFDELSWYLVKSNFNDGDFGERKSIPKREPFSTVLPYAKDAKHRKEGPATAEPEARADVRAERTPRTKVALIAEACTTNRSVVGCRTTSKAVAAAGFVPLVLPNEVDDAKLGEMLARADALVLFGSVRGEVQARYDFERKLVRMAAAQNKPVLGICNGHQQINVALGGTYGPNATNAPVKVQHRWIASTWTNDQFHAVSVKPGSLMAKTFGEDHPKVNSSHMYSVKKIAPGFEVTAVAEDGVVEAIEHRTKPIVGVQFHPERQFVRDGDKRALALIKAALEGNKCRQEVP